MNSNKFLNNYSELSQPIKGKLRNFARKLILDTASLSISETYLTKPKVQFLYFHHTFKDEVNGLRKILTHLSKQNTFISYSEAVERVKNNQIDKPYICFSSDDGFKNNFENAKILTEFGIKCCYFICPQFIGENKYEKLQSISGQKFHLSKAIEFLDWNEVELMLKMGHEIGSHTMTHRRLSNIDITELHSEIIEPKDILHTKLGIKELHFAYPYGLATDINNEAITMINTCGYISCASAIRGVHQPTVTHPKNLIFKRDLVLFNWNVKHIDWFMHQNIKKQANN